MSKNRQNAGLGVLLWFSPAKANQESFHEERRARTVRTVDSCRTVNRICILFSQVVRVGEKYSYSGRTVRNQKKVPGSFLRIVNKIVKRCRRGML
jgi:hypothetical protein